MGALGGAYTEYNAIRRALFVVCLVDLFSERTEHFYLDEILGATSSLLHGDEVVDACHEDLDIRKLVLNGVGRQRSKALGACRGAEDVERTEGGIEGEGVSCRQRLRIENEEDIVLDPAKPCTGVPENRGEALEVSRRPLVTDVQVVGHRRGSVEPAADAQSPQSKKCATCQHSQWGSRISEEGKKGKSCNDVKRLAVASPTQLNDPMLLRLPPTTLKIWDEYVRMLNKRGGYKPAQVVTKVRFDPDVVHQQLTFKATALISPEMAIQVMEERDSLIVRNIIGVGPDAGPPVQDAPAAPKEEPAKAPEKPAKAAKPAPKEAEKPAPAAKEVDMDELGDDLDAMLDGLGFDDE